MACDFKAARSPLNTVARTVQGCSPRRLLVIMIIHHNQEAFGCHVGVCVYPVRPSCWCPSGLQLTQQSRWTQQSQTLTDQRINDIGSLRRRVTLEFYFLDTSTPYTSLECHYHDPSLQLCCLNCQLLMVVSSTAIISSLPIQHKKKAMYVTSRTEASWTTCMQCIWNVGCPACPCPFDCPQLRTPQDAWPSLSVLLHVMLSVVSLNMIF